MNQLHIIRGSDLNTRDNVFEIGRRHYRFLAHGDSWFSIGSVPLAPVGNVLTDMRLSKTAVAINCARPGHTLARMTDFANDRWYRRALLQPNGWDWHALLLSCGGNDLIDACQVPAHAPDGQRIPLAQRIFRAPDEWGDPAADVQRFPNLHFLDPMGIPLVAAALRDTGNSGDWGNEIHLNHSGLQKFAPRYAALVEQVLQQQGLPA